MGSGSRASLFRQSAARVLGLLVAAGMVAGPVLIVSQARATGAQPRGGATCGFSGTSPCSDVAMTLTHEPSRVEIGRPFKAKMSVHNFGLSTALSVIAVDDAPSSFKFKSVSPPAAYSCTTPPVGETGSVSCSSPSMASGTTDLIVVVWRPTVSGLQTNQSHVTVSGSFDPNSGNNADSDGIDVQTNLRGCTMIGTVNADVMTGTSGADVICGLGGADQIDGSGGSDTIYGQDGADQLTDHNGTDVLRGGPGNDTLDTSDGAGGDIANGNIGTDTCTVDGGDTAAHCE